jgi:hypothetical protein
MQQIHEALLFNVVKMEIFNDDSNVELSFNLVNLDTLMDNKTVALVLS